MGGGEAGDGRRALESLVVERPEVIARPETVGKKKKKKKRRTPRRLDLAITNASAAAAKICALGPGEKNKRVLELS